jgi:hypothetical protein
MKPMKLTHLRAWEMNADGTRAGLAFTARDTEPLKEDYFAGVVIDDEPATLTLYGTLVQQDLLNPDIPYGLELWAPLVTHLAADRAHELTQWAYFMMPMSRMVRDFNVGFDGTEYFAAYTHPDGHTYPSVTFNLHTGHQWGRGPHPVRLVEVGDELQPAYLDDIATTYNRVMTTTTMAPETALQYTEHITHRKPARKAIG